MAESSDNGSVQEAETGVTSAPGDTIAESANLFLMARRALMASLGAVAITLDESNDFLARLVDRGEVAETDITRLVNDYVSRSNAREEKTTVSRRSTVDRATVALADSVEVILERLNVPTHSDIEELSRKIGLLNDKVLMLKQKGMTSPQSRAGVSGPALEAEPPEHVHTNGDV